MTVATATLLLGIPVAAVAGIRSTWSP